MIFAEDFPHWGPFRDFDHDFSEGNSMCAKKNCYDSVWCTIRLHMRHTKFSVYVTHTGCFSRFRFPNTFLNNSNFIWRKRWTMNRMLNVSVWTELRISILFHTNRLSFFARSLKVVSLNLNLFKWIRKFLTIFNPHSMCFKFYKENLQNWL